MKATDSIVFLATWVTALAFGALNHCCVRRALTRLERRLRGW